MLWSYRHKCEELEQKKAMGGGGGGYVARQSPYVATIASSMHVERISMSTLLSNLSLLMRKLSVVTPFLMGEGLR